MKQFAWITLAVVVAFGAGWLVGGSGRSAAEVSAGRAIEQAGFLEARMLILDGQVRVSEMNFGDARERFEAARAAVERLQRRLRETGQAERAGLLEVAIGYLTEAAEKSAALDAGGGSAAEAALHTLEAVGAG